MPGRGAALIQTAPTVTWGRPWPRPAASAASLSSSEETAQPAARAPDASPKQASIRGRGGTGSCTRSQMHVRRIVSSLLCSTAQWSTCFNDRMNPKNEEKNVFCVHDYLVVTDLPQVWSVTPRQCDTLVSDWHELELVLHCVSVCVCAPSLFNTGILGEWRASFLCLCCFGSSSVPCLFDHIFCCCCLCSRGFSFRFHVIPFSQCTDCQTDSFFLEFFSLTLFTKMGLTLCSTTSAVLLLGGRFVFLLALSCGSSLLHAVHVIFLVLWHRLASLVLAFFLFLF